MADFKSPKLSATDILSSCRTTYTNRFLSVMKSSAADTVLKHWLVVMKKSAPILQGTTNQNGSLSGTNLYTFPKVLLSRSEFFIVRAARKR